MTIYRKLIRIVGLAGLLAAAVGLAAWAAAGGPPRRAAAQSTGAGQTLIMPGDPAAVPGFGKAVALSSDTLAVGAEYTSIDGQDAAGAVVLYERDPATGDWAESRQVQAETPVELAFLGRALALDGDTLVVGAPMTLGDAGYGQGAAYVFERDAGGPGRWGFVARLADETEDVLRYFGAAVAVDGDLIAVGAWGADESRGEVLLYSRAAGWARIMTLTDPTGQPRDAFGQSLALRGDSLVVGAPYVDADATMADSGAAFVFERDAGGPGQWGLAARRVAGLPDGNGRFGSQVAIDGDRIVVTAPYEDRYVGGQFDAQDVGAAYIFERDEGGAGQWGPVAALRPSDGQLLEFFGRSVALAGERVWAGASDSEAGGLDQPGILYAYERQGDGSWAEQPPVQSFDGGLDDNFGFSLSAGDDELVAGAPDRLPEAAVYVIGVSATTTESTSSFMPTLMGEWFATTGVLEDGSSLESPEGAVVGAVPGTFAAPIEATIMVNYNPSPALPPGFVPRGDRYLLAARTLIVAPEDKPLLVGLPVPAGADIDHLGVAMLIPDKLFTEQSEPDTLTRSWTAAPGRYDPATNLFVTTASALRPEGITLTLFEHPDNEPLPAAAPATRAAAEVAYRVQCDPVTWQTGVCDAGYYLLIGDMMEEAHRAFVDDHGFQPPRLVHLAGIFTGADKTPALDTVDYFGVVIAEKPCKDSSGRAIDGKYTYESMQILICIDPLGSTEALERAVRHELFHAVQASYTPVAEDRNKQALKETDWLVEGTATAAERSGDTMLRSPRATLRRATDPLLSNDDLLAYQAQDLWVFTGLDGSQGDQTLAYLKPIFEQGATPQHVDAAMSLDEAYWVWAKNQVFEHEQAMDGAFGVGPCEFDPHTYDGTQVRILDYPAAYRLEGTLPPLTTAIVMIRSAVAREIMPVGASNSTNPLDLRYKVVQIGEENCRDVDDGARILRNIAAGGERYVLVANVSYTQAFEYVVEVD